MADDIRVTAGGASDPPVATNDKGGRHVQIVQLDFGDDSTISVAEGSLPINDNGGAITVDGTVSLTGTVPLPTGAATDSALTAPFRSTGETASGTPTVVLQGAIRRDEDTNWPGVDDGEYSPLITNRDGRLKVAGAPAQFNAVTGSITANAQTVSADVSSVSNVVVQLSGTFSAHNVTFEASLDDGSTWGAIQGVRSNANTIELTSGSLSAAPAYFWEFSVNAYTNFRVRATAHTSGTANYRFTLGSYATEPIPAIQSHGITGSVTNGASTNLIGDVGLQVRANATGAASIHHIVSAASTNVAQIKSTAGRVLGYCLSNTTASWRYVKLHNVASATAGAAVAMTIGLPPNGKAECHIGQGIAFSTAISRSIVTGAADADTTAVSANDVVGDIFFA